MDQYVDYDLNPFTLECVFAGETKKLDMVSMRIDFPEVDLSE